MKHHIPKTYFFYLTAVGIIIDAICIIGYLSFANAVYYTNPDQNGLARLSTAAPYYLVSSALSAGLILLLLVTLRLTASAGHATRKFLQGYILFNLFFLSLQCIGDGLLALRGLEILALSAPLVKFFAQFQWGYLFALGMGILIYEAKGHVPEEELLKKA